MAVRVHELAREFGVESKTIIRVLTENGVFIKSASSTVESPSVLLLNEHFAAIREDNPTKTSLARPQPRPARRLRSTAGSQIRRLPRPNKTSVEPSLEEEVALLKRKSQRGKRHRGAIDVATQQTLEFRMAHDPPFKDEYESAYAETSAWLDLGWIAPEEIVRWRLECPGISAEVGMSFHNAGMSARLAKTRWDGRRLDPEGELSLYSSMSTSMSLGRLEPARLTFDDALWLLRRAGLAS